MGWFFNWWRERRAARTLAAKMDALTRKVESVRNARIRSERRLDASEQLLSSLRDELNEQFKLVDRAINESRQVVKAQEIALDTANEQIRMLQDILVPGLVASNQSLVARFEAETAVHTARAMAIQTSQKSGID